MRYCGERKITRGAKEVHGESDAETRRIDAVLCAKYQAGDKAAGERMVRRHMGLAVLTAGKYKPEGVLTSGDYITLAMRGALEATGRFKPDAGAKFSTYAVLWMKAFIRREIMDMRRTIRIPGNVYFATPKIMKKMDAGKELTKREKEMMADTEASISYSMDWRGRSTNADDIDGSIVHEYGDPTAITDEAASERLMRDTVTDLLHCLDEREKSVISLRFGIGSMVSMTLSDCGDVYGISKERVRQIEDQAMRKMRIEARRAGILEHAG